MIEQFSLWIELIQDRISVTLMAGCEDYDLPVFFHFFEKRNSIWSDIESNVYWEAIDVDSELDIWLRLVPLKAVNESLI